MEDFASAAMVRLIHAGLVSQGLATDMARPGAGAHVSLASKREGVESILATHGALALLRIGQIMPEFRDSPLLAAMETARTPQELVSRWRRLETYVHSKHRTEIVDEDARGFTLRHVSIVARERPLRSEDLLVFGVIIALIQWSGAVGLRAKPVGDIGWVYDGDWVAEPDAEDCATWHIEWDQVTGDAHDVDAGQSSPTLADLIRMDPIRRWTLAEAAKQLVTSPRSLQRRLQSTETTFSKVAADVRAAHAVRLLDTTDMSLAEIGFLSGYSDQAHFTRCFKRAMAVSPLSYRRKA